MTYLVDRQASPLRLQTKALVRLPVRQLTQTSSYYQSIWRLSQDQTIDLTGLAGLTFREEDLPVVAYFLVKAELPTGRHSNQLLLDLLTLARYLGFSSCSKAKLYQAIFDQQILGMQSTPELDGTSLRSLGGYSVTLFLHLSQDLAYPQDQTKTDNCLESFKEYLHRLRSPTWSLGVELDLELAKLLPELLSGFKDIMTELDCLVRLEATGSLNKGLGQLLLLTANRSSDIGCYGSYQGPGGEFYRQLRIYQQLNLGLRPDHQTQLLIDGNWAVQKTYRVDLPAGLPFVWTTIPGQAARGYTLGSQSTISKVTVGDVIVMLLEGTATEPDHCFLTDFLANLSQIEQLQAFEPELRQLLA